MWVPYARGADQLAPVVSALPQPPDNFDGDLNDRQRDLRRRKNTLITARYAGESQLFLHPP
jgi:hypothetical protein